jgi:hypothetical protein
MTWWLRFWWRRWLSGDRSLTHDKAATKGWRMSLRAGGMGTRKPGGDDGCRPLKVIMAGSKQGAGFGSREATQREEGATMDGQQRPGHGGHGREAR